jgi:hypothetical protein
MEPSYWLAAHGNHIIDAIATLHDVGMPKVLRVDAFVAIQGNPLLAIKGN